MVNYYSRFIKELATTAEPLRRLTRKNIRFSWTAACKSANSVRSFIFDRIAPTFVTTDASDVGLGGSPEPDTARLPPVSTRRESKSATKRDSTLSTVLHFVSSGWPNIKTRVPDIKQFFAVRDELHTEDQCLLREKNRIVLPTALRRRLLTKAHEGHPGHGIQSFHASGEAWASGIQALLRNYRATAATPHGRSLCEVMFNRPPRLPFQIPASAHRARPPSAQLATSAPDARGFHSRGPYRVGNRVLARRPQVLKGQSPWSKLLAVLKVLGNWTYRLSYGHTWNARKLRRYLQPEAPFLHHHETAAPPVRRSQRQNRGVIRARYPNESSLFSLHKLHSY
ncbi:transposon tf2-6 polyprotein [Plakobranchus ocellatus]|uniref:Transposon tf2-6 polyprotein n=1 Tax=Plakobranchus ocellatus TaxID=259542 RepID=A0AAV3XU23_9GAST|nr:transposon tf2-6 polyprotein [Plakobranchus ocellatus]